MRWTGTLAGAFVVVGLMPDTLSCQSARYGLWGSVAAGGTSGGDLLTQTSLWFKRDRLVLGARRGNASQPLWAEHHYKETAVLAGVRRPLDAESRHATVVLAAGIAQKSGWQGPAAGCVFGCGSWERLPIPVTYAPTASIDVQGATRWIGIGLSFTGLAGAHGYAGVTLAIQLGAIGGWTTRRGD